MERSELKHPLTISDLARRTGVPPATLRSWEARYGFPRPTRMAGGHRRYGEPEVAAVLEVVRHRDGGLALEAAVRRVTTESARPRSIYAELRRWHPLMATQVLSKASLVALSRAIEDECCARAQEPLLFGCFQRDTFLRASRARWVELARTARAAVVFAESAVPAAPRPGAPIEVALPQKAALNREWAVVCDAPDLPACLAAVERPGQDGVADALRRFDAVWTVDPRVVRDASRVAATLADEYRPGWRPAGLALPEDEPPSASADLRRASDLMNRTMGYLDSVR
ncbi:DICT sensory domain-containing protein [Nocardioides sp. URHA0020]|uniref:DICT sensory domain-containing protein n=1 Tax=Nocardioides sp. URHA0020 TaxID=1380392 RepID=UPI00048E8A63|nr:DICT sensory domain-containing protein [Nocardioides sp. URHA0020]